MQQEGYFLNFRFSEIETQNSQKRRIFRFHQPHLENRKFNIH